MDAVAIFENSNDPVELLKALYIPAEETLKLLKNYIFPKFRHEKMKELLRFECREIPTGAKKLTYLYSFVRVQHPAAEAAKSLINEDMENIHASLKKYRVV